jgi:GMP synthase (glutamine-hydrolysing)
LRRILIVKTGEALPELLASVGDFEDWIAAGMGLARGDVDVVAPYREEVLPDPAECRGAVVTGSSALVSDREPWSERTAAWLADAVRAETPLLGICYGHQLLAHALGGEVARNPRGREIGTIELRTLEPARRDPLLSVLADGDLSQATHVESVVRLPPGAVLLAGSAGDPHQAFSVGRRAWGLQFHPEFDAGIVRGYLRARADEAAAEGLDPQALLLGVRESPSGPRLLRRFSELLPRR